MKVETENNFSDEKNRQWLKVLLKERPVTLTFTKKNGEKRVMNATLSENIIPQVKNSSENTETRKYSAEAQPVYDLDAKGWRSFRWDSLTGIEFSLGTEK